MHKNRRNKIKDQLVIWKEQELETPFTLVKYPEYECFCQIGEIHTEKFDIYELNGKISINDYIVYGWVEYRKKCKVCHHNLIFDIDGDDHFCPECNKWLYPICKDSECEICTNRPEKPLPDFGVNEDTYSTRKRGGWERFYTIQLDF